MAFAETSSARLAYTEEASYGVNPATGAQFLRITSESLKQTQQRTTSEEVTGNRNPRESIRTGINAEGSVEFEVSVNAIDDIILEGACMADLPAAPSLITGSLQAVASTQKIVSSGTPSLAGISKGQWVRLAGFTNAENNGIFRAASASTSTELELIASSGIVDEASAAGRKVQPSQMIRPSNSLKSYTLERQWLGGVNVYEPFSGMVVESLDLTIAKEAVITGSISFMGQDMGAPTTSSGIGTVTAAGTEQIASAVDNFRNVREGSLATDTTERTVELSLSLKNGTRMKKDAASATPFGVGLGVIELTGKWKVYLQTKALVDKYRGNTVTPLSFRINGPSSTSPDYVITLPKVRFTDVSDPISGNSDDGYVDISWQGETDSDGVALQFDKVPAI